MKLGAIDICKNVTFFPTLNKFTLHYIKKPWKQTTAAHILPNTSRSKGNQTMKVGQLIEYTMGNIFLEKLYTKYGEEIIPRYFIKNQN